MNEVKYSNKDNKEGGNKYGDIETSHTADRMDIISPNLDMPEEDIEKGDDVVIGGFWLFLLRLSASKRQHYGSPDSPDKQLHSD
jgi:hypothetical protein